MLAAQVGTVLDRIRLFEAAEQEQKRLSAVLHSAADAILVIDTQGCLRLTNSAAEQLFTDAHLGTPLPMKKGYDDLVDLLNKQRQNGNPEQAEVTWPDQRTFSVLVTPVEEGGQVAVLHDVSHFKAIDHLKSEFIATASHDLKNPIFAVLGYSDLLEKAGPLNELQSDFVNRVRNASIQMRDLVMNLLEMARMDMGMKLKLESVDLNETLTSVVEEFQPQADARHHLIMVELSTTPACVMGDKIRLQQVARNLFSNAIKYTPDGGQITVSSEVGSDRVLVNFRDTGIGIPEDSLPHLFEKFYRVHTKETQDIEGNGLGLAIVKSIIEQHGGRVTVESTLGKGSCFRVEFPMGKKDM